ncbi:MAG: hypothetical protein LBJ02_02145 [Bifidobacteriaceae bacterium]|nr:hypothetical protein [Bifidobacteriaceae bacterium]
MAKALSLNDIRSRAAAFAHEWRDAEGYERGEAQSFVRDLLGVYGITETRAGLYEHRVKRSSNDQRGYIDALVPGLAVIEMKSAGKDLLAARDFHPDWRLAGHSPLAVTPELLKAHAALDRVMDKAMDAKCSLRDNDERLSLLFANYEAMTRQSWSTSCARKSRRT